MTSAPPDTPTSSIEIDWRIPPSVKRWLAECPTDKTVAILLRHSVRGPLPNDAPGDDIPLTEEGIALARELGALIGARLRTLHASPIPRCVQTASALREGASLALEITEDRLLGAPGIYVVDGARAWVNWQTLGHEGVMAHLESSDERLPGMADPAPAANFLVRHMLAAAGGQPGFHIFVTHDSLVATTAARLLGSPLGRSAWPWFLEGAFFWPEGDELVRAYRDHIKRGQRWRDGLNERALIDFARRELFQVVGPECQARFFLAGGAFKTLLTGLPPRDLDLWAPSTQDRALLMDALIARGARALPPHPFADAFEIGGRVVELPHKVEPNTLEGRLARFDLALSALGVEHQPGGHLRALVHPLARESAERGEVLLLKPLVNWKYALTTLERARRYARELGFEVPEAEEAEIWRVFDAQPEATRRAMLERFDRTTHGGFGVREEVERRFSVRA